MALTDPEKRRINKYVQQVDRLWRIDYGTHEVLFDPQGGWSFRWSHKLFLRPRTELRHLYFWQAEKAASVQGMPFTVSMDHDNTHGIPEAPRKMYVSGGWKMAKSSARHVKSTEGRPHVAILLNMNAAEMTPLVRPWTRRERFYAFVSAVLAFGGAITSILAWLEVPPP